jgi:hypothetical protein
MSKWLIVLISIAAGIIVLRFLAKIALTIIAVAIKGD